VDRPIVWVPRTSVSCLYGDLWHQVSQLIVLLSSIIYVVCYAENKNMKLRLNIFDMLLAINAMQRELYCFSAIAKCHAIHLYSANHSLIVMTESSLSSF